MDRSEPGDKPGYEGYMNERVLSLPELMRDGGYYTFMAGKWHLGMEPSQGPQARGFIDSFAMLPGAGGHYDQTGINPKLPVIPYSENGRAVTLPKDFYSTSYYTDRAIEYIDKSLQAPEQPFFGYVAYTAPHWPLQVDSRYSDKYRGKYSKGYSALKAERLERMRDKGIVQAGVKFNSGSGCNEPWDELSSAERRRQEHSMELYAGMVDALDEHIGRLIAHLKAVGVYENSLIVFISDNGADARPERGMGEESEFLDANFDNRFENMGTSTSFVSYGAAWAEVGSAPFRLHKGMTTEGGIRVPAIIRLPGSEERGVVKRDFASVLDILPTFLDAAGIPDPDKIAVDRGVFPPVGKSMMAYLQNQTERLQHDEPYGFSVHRRQGLQFNQWKIVRLPIPYGDESWELYDLDADPGETTNLSATMPEKTAEMVARWNEFAATTGIVIAERASRVPAECARAGS
ncbi:sulfatase-like hydrolase/transferase [Haliea sp. E1-2-M8]|uniref:sulfatase-like hydrolase/transferase n=1 Tax=Haliea sp. E1-2-M8 TaxID=3064706 RepID=UPI0027199DED|nr:sulfatase-like hydrolase/transferase [Haliea sp. E1-2-M8]MDO8863939.1 sulfatase-like hydrolase/transferase [Haliea sp. E1-2-M8]